MVIELHHGTIRAASGGRGEGASFLINLPLAKNSGKSDGPVQPASPAKTPEPEGKPARSGARGRILLVEDHAATRFALERLLMRRQFEVATTASLAGAKALMHEGKFDILISDVGLPDGSGYELMGELKADPSLKGIALTGYGMDQDLERSKDAGFRAHLTKPVTAQALDEAIATVFEN
jgi:CheY-like chemotaxis protein